MELVCWIVEACWACSAGLVEGQFVLDVHARWMPMQGTSKEKTRKACEKSRCSENHQKKEIRTINN